MKNSSLVDKLQRYYDIIWN